VVLMPRLLRWYYYLLRYALRQYIIDFKQPLSCRQAWQLVANPNPNANDRSERSASAVRLLIKGAVRVEDEFF
jgi:hypothetical protein